jgi:chemotaxis-related protein WspD
MEPGQDWEGRATDARVAEEIVAASSEVLSLVIFRLEGQWLALPTQIVREVAEVRTIRSIPQRNTGVLLGLINLRGELQLCVSLKEMLGPDGEREYVQGKGQQRTARLVVVEKEEDCWVFPADEVSGVFHFTPSDFHELPTAPAAGAAVALKGTVYWLEKQVSCFDETVLFDTLKRRIS